MPRGRADEDALTAGSVALASQYGRYGCRRVAAMLREAGWVVNTKWVPVEAARSEIGFLAFFQDAHRLAVVSANVAGFGRERVARLTMACPS